MLSILINELRSVFPHLLEFLKAEETVDLLQTCHSLKALTRSCIHWTVCQLPCITATPEIVLPSNFVSCNSIVIQNNSASSTDSGTVEPACVALEGCVYEDGYLHFCHLMSTPYGWGMFARKTIPAHTALITYTGELISNEETECRLRQYDQQVRKCPLLT